MAAIVRAMTWEFWRRSGWTMSQIVVVSFCLVAVLLMANDLSHEQTTGMHAVFLRLAVASFIGIVLTAQGSRTHFLDFCQIRPPSWLYALPVPSWMISGLYMLHSIVAVVAMYLVTVLALNATFHLDWPLLGPSIFVAAVTASVQGIIWLFSRHPRIQLAFSLSLMIPFFVWVALLNTPQGAEPENWRDFTPKLGLTYASCVAIGYVLATLGVTHDRRGFVGVDMLFESVKKCGSFCIPRFRNPRTFANRNAAQKSYNRRRAGVAGGLWIPVAMISVGCASVPCLSWMQIGRPPQHTAILATIISLAMCIQAGRHVLAIVFATRSLSGFEATRPLTDAQMARGLLATATRACLLTFLTLLLCQLSLWWGTAVYFRQQSASAVMRELLAAPISNVFTIVYSILILWIVPWTASTIMWPLKHAAVHHRKILTAGLLTFIGLIISMGVLSSHPSVRLTLSETTRETLIGMLLIPIPAVSLLWSTYANWRAERSGLISRRALALVVVGYCALIGMHLAMWLASGDFPPVAVQFLALGISALPFSSPASVYLVVAADRHR